MVDKIIVLSYLLFHLNNEISSMTISPSQSNTLLTVTLAPSDWTAGVEFYISIQGRSCLHTDNLVISSANTLTSKDKSVTFFCTKATLSSNQFISNTVQLRVGTNIKAGSEYTGFMVQDGKIIATAQFMSMDSKSSAVSIVKVTSDYNTERLTVTWMLPSKFYVFYGQIVKYYVWLTSYNGICMLNWILNCSDCVSKTAGDCDAVIFNPPCRHSANLFFSRTWQGIILLSNQLQIIPYTKYIIHVAAVNGYGWSYPSSVKFMTGPYISDAVSNILVTWSSTGPMMNLTWTPPSTPNGQIVQYIVLAQNLTNNDCILWLIINCGNCGGDSPGTNGKTAISTNCQSINYNNQFSQYSSLISISVTSTLLIQNNRYNITVIPVNQFGWGKSSSIETTSSQYDSVATPMYTGSLTSIATTMSGSSKTPSADQIPIILPYSYFASNRNKITGYTLVVVVNGKERIQNQPNNATEKTYLQCNRGNDCAYVIKLPFPPITLRRKRDTTSSNQTYSNVQFNIGDNSNCGATCNGPLNANTEYLIGFRVCANTECNLVTITKSTTSGLTIFLIPIIIFVILIPLVIVFVWYLRKLKCRGKIDVLVEQEVPPPGYTPSKDESYNNPIFSNIYDTINYEQSSQKTSGHQINKMEDNLQSRSPAKLNIVTINEYNDPINFSRVCAKQCSQSDTRACSCQNFYITTEWPVIKNSETSEMIGKFWKLIIEWKVNLILDLTGNDSYLNHDNVKEMNADSIFGERKLEIILHKSRKEVTHVRFMNWPKRKYPKINEFIDFYRKYTNIKKYDDIVGVVNCRGKEEASTSFMLIDMTFSGNNGTRTRTIIENLDKEQSSFVNEVIDEMNDNEIYNYIM